MGAKARSNRLSLSASLSMELLLLKGEIWDQCPRQWGHRARNGKETHPAGPGHGKQWRGEQCRTRQWCCRTWTFQPKFPALMARMLSWTGMGPQRGWNEPESEDTNEAPPNRKVHNATVSYLVSPPRERVWMLHQRTRPRHQNPSDSFLPVSMSAP